MKASNESDLTYFENPDCTECSNYHVIMWPKETTRIPRALNKNPNDSLSANVGFSQLKCFSKVDITGSAWEQDCTVG